MGTLSGGRLRQRDLSDAGRRRRLYQPILVRKTKTPPSIPDRVKLNEKEATFFIQDIYEGEGLKGIPRGTVKSLRLHAYEYAYVKTRSDHNWHGSSPVGISSVCWGRFLSKKTVP